MKRLILVLAFWAIYAFLLAAPAWHDVGQGTNQPSSLAANYVSPWIDGTNVYVGFVDQAAGNRITVRECDDLTNWKTVGIPGFSRGGGGYLKLIFPYIAFQDYSAGNSVSIYRWNIGASVVVSATTNFYNQTLTDVSIVNPLVITNIVANVTNLIPTTNYHVEVITDETIVTPYFITNNLVGYAAFTNVVTNDTTPWVTNLEITNVYAPGYTNIYTNSNVVQLTEISNIFKFQLGNVVTVVANTPGTYTNIITNVFSGWVNGEYDFYSYVVSNAFAADKTNIFTNSFAVAQYNFTNSITNDPRVTYYYPTFVHTNFTGSFTNIFTNSFYYYANTTVSSNLWQPYTTNLFAGGSLWWSGVSGFDYWINSNGVMFCAIADASKGGKLGVYQITNRNNGAGIWYGTNLTTTSADYINLTGDISIDTNSYVATIDASKSGRFLIYNNYLLGSHLVPNTNGLFANSTAYNLGLQVWNNYPYVMFQSTIPGNLVLATYTNSKWTNYGPQNFASRAQYPAFAMGTNGTAWVAYSDVNNSGKLAISYLTNGGTGWTTTNGVTSNAVAEIKMFIDTNGAPVCSYTEQGRLKMKVWY